MKTLKILIFLTVFAIFSLIGLYYIAWLFSPGSYAKAEVYKINLPEKELIEVINRVKTENPELLLPTEMQNVLAEGRKGSGQFDYWYHIYFYYSDKNQIINTWTRPHTKNVTSFAFVAVNDGLILGNWKNVNEYFFWWKNEPMKNEFESRILSKIKAKINSD